VAQSLYDKYGGFPVISAIVQTFYDKIGETDELSHFFSNVSMEALMSHQTKFLCKVLGGPDNYEGRSLAKAHAGLNIDGRTFALVGQLLQESLEEAGVEPDDVKMILSVVVGVRNDIVTA